MLLDYQYNDGGRSVAGFKGTTRDCVVRAIAIACDLDYGDLYRKIRKQMGASASPRDGVPKKIYRPMLSSMGWRWVPLMGIGTGCTTHLRADELPQDRLIVGVSRHMLTVIDHVMHDVYRDDRGGTRCVYGYWIK